MKKMAFVLLGLVAIGVVSYVTGALGYLMGGPQYTARFAPTDALYTVAVLKKLREGKTDQAIDLLEVQLDSRIVDHSTFNPNIAKWLDVISPIGNTNSDRLMTEVAKYREEYPTRAVDPEVREHINNHLKAYLP